MNNKVTRRIFLKQGLIATSTLLVPWKLFAEKPVNTINLTILHTNDIHGYITKSIAEWADPDFPPDLGGGSALATLIKQVKMECKQKDRRFMLLDAGDIYQGTPIGDESKGATIVDFFNRMGYDCWTLGNHDFDDGDKNVEKLISASKMPVLSSNTRSSKNKKEFPYGIKPYIIKNVDGLKIGILGITTEDMITLVPKEKLPEIVFTNVAPTVNKYILELKKQEVQFIILLSHLGFPRVDDGLSRRLKRFNKYRKNADARKFPNYTAYLNFIKKKKGFGLDDLEVTALIKNINLVIGGHSHIGIYPPYEVPETHTFITQAYSRLSTVGRIDLSLDKDTGTIIGISIEAINLWGERFKPDNDAEDYLRCQQDAVEKHLRRVIGKTETELQRGNYETTLGNVVTDAMRESVGADVALVNRGGLRANIRIGEIQEIDIYRVIPFDNPIHKMTVDGAMLANILEVSFSGRRKDSQLSGVKVVVNPLLPSGRRLCEVCINGKPLDLKKQYTFATSAYLSDGAVGYGLLRKIQRDMVKESITVRKAVVQYIEKKTPLNVSLEGRIKISTKATRADYLP
ncbi:MAG: bifunctional metallophosphatase/5'-nucleotidase [Candidatus Coatesbacteria bacterium]|nr:bifunctional metallophosphatase/5'-nucleotidase [Candidatus Coatesbacteria bacterium]